MHQFVNYEKVYHLNGVINNQKTSALKRISFKDHLFSIFFLLGRVVHYIHKCSWLIFKDFNLLILHL